LHSLCQSKTIIMYLVRNYSLMCKYCTCLYFHNEVHDYRVSLNTCATGYIKIMSKCSITLIFVNWDTHFQKSEWVDHTLRQNYYCNNFLLIILPLSYLSHTFYHQAYTQLITIQCFSNWGLKTFIQKILCNKVMQIDSSGLYSILFIYRSW
jgi:hypothetical protein